MMYLEPDEYGERISDLEEEDYLARTDDEDWDDNRSMFQDPGGNSALRAASKSNPRNLPCPTCGSPNRLTPKDVALHYQCNSCADAAEGGYDHQSYGEY